MKHPPFVQFKAPTVWTTLGLTLRADGTSEFEVLGASKFPRHWIYDDDGQLAAKVGLANFKDWYRDAFGKYTPWGERDSKALVTAVETALERELSTRIMQKDTKAEIRTIKRGSDSSNRERRGTNSSSSSTVCSRSSLTASRLPRWVPARSSASARCSKVGSVAPHWKRRPRAGSRSHALDQIDRAALLELAEKHRRETK